MANEPEEVRTDYEENGGPVKSFLEHLEDLRWTLIKSAAAVAVGMVVCLIAGDTIVHILKLPLERSSVNRPPRKFTPCSCSSGLITWLLSTCPRIKLARFSCGPTRPLLTSALFNSVRITFSRSNPFSTRQR